NIHILWIFGILIPAFYALLLINYKTLIKGIREKDALLSILLLLFIVQVLSISFSPLYPFFSLDRFLVIIHILVSFVFLIFVYTLSKNETVRNYIFYYSKYYLFFILIFAPAYFFYSLLSAKYIEYNNILYFLTGVKNTWTTTVFNSHGW